MPDPVDDLWQKWQASGGGAASSDPANAPVYFGTTPGRKAKKYSVPLNRMQPTPPGGPTGPVSPYRDYGYKADKGRKPKHREMTVRAATNQIYEDQKFLEKVRKRLIAAGLLTAEQAAQVSNVEKVWGDVLETSSKFWANGRKLTPWDVLELQKKSYDSATVGGGSEGSTKGISSVTGALLPGWTTGKDGKPVYAPYGLDPETGKPKKRMQSTTATSESVNELSDGDAWAVMQQAASQALGREVSHEEVREFAYRANRIAAENPDEVTTKQTVDARTGDSDTHTTRSQGFGSSDAQRMAEEEMRDTPEYGKVQSATTYANALFSALDSPVSGF